MTKLYQLITVNPKILFICSFLLFIFQHTLAQNTIDISSVNASDFIGKHIEFFKEDGKNLTIDEIQTKPFETSKKDVLSFGYSPDAVWLRFKVKNSSDTFKNKVLSIYKSLQDTVQLYQKDGIHWKMKESGQMIMEKDKELPGFSISFPFDLAKHSTETFYVRVVSKYSKVLAVKMLDKHQYNEHEKREYTIAYVLIGILMTIIIYNLLLARTLKDHIYDYYSLAVFSSLCLQLLFRGYIKAFIIDEHPFLQEWTPIFIFCFSTICLSIFCIKFLNTKKHSKIADWSFKTLILLKVFAFFYPFISYQVFGIYTDARLLGYFAILFSFIAIFAGILVYKNGNTSARFLIYAWLVLCIAVILYSLASLAIIPANIITMNAYVVGSVLEVFLLSIALGDRFIQLRKERITLKKSLLQQERVIAKKNEEIADLKIETLRFIKSKQYLTEELKNISKQKEGITLQEVINSLQADKVTDSKLEILKQDINTVNANYTANLKAKYPNLTKGDMELASFILLGLTRREIAMLRNTSFDAVKKSINRFRKKIGIQQNESVIDFIKSITD